MTLAASQNQLSFSSSPATTIMNTMRSSFNYYFVQFWQENSDPRFNKSTLMSGGPLQMLTITLSYLIFVTLIGPSIMRKRKPIENLMWPIRLYNGFMVLFNAYLFINLSKKLNWGLDCWGCGKAMEPVDQVVLKLWELTLLSRYFDFFDSFFFVCRKKFDHLSLLHITHHTLVPIIVWAAGKLYPTPSVIFAGYINLSIHVIMYTYYCLSTFPKLREYLWWKKYLTSVQIVQFLIELVHALQVFYYPSCNFCIFTKIQIGFSLTFLYLFGQFYLKNYIKKRKTPTMETSRKHHETILQVPRVDMTLRNSKKVN